MSLPLPSTLSSVDGLAAQLDAATHDERVTWVRSLGRREQYALFELCRGALPLGPGARSVGAIYRPRFDLRPSRAPSRISCLTASANPFSAK